MKCYIIKTSGKIEEQEKDIKSYPAINKALGVDLVERVTFPWGEMWCDECAKIKKDAPPVNPTATFLYCRSFVAGTTHSNHDIWGDVLIRVKKNYRMHLFQVVNYKTSGIKCTILPERK